MGKKSAVSIAAEPTVQFNWRMNACACVQLYIWQAENSIRLTSFPNQFCNVENGEIGEENEKKKSKRICLKLAEIGNVNICIPFDILQNTDGVPNIYFIFPKWK